jgi:hypothetical protein
METEPSLRHHLLDAALHETVDELSRFVPANVSRVYTLKGTQPQRTRSASLFGASALAHNLRL